MSRPRRVAGVDASRGGWLAVWLEDGRFLDTAAYRSLRDVVADARVGQVVAVDVPIGLPAHGVRRADIAARAFVGPRRSSVFAAPSRAALAQPTYAEARRVQPSLSAQSYALKRAIDDAAACAHATLVEVHPEVSFRALAGRPLAYSKRTWNGMHDRIELLGRAGIDLPWPLSTGTSPADDVLDAAVAAWTADRIARDVHATLPAEPVEGEPTITY